MDFFKKLDTETVNDYICRLGLYREKYNLCWNDLIEPIYREFGIELTKAAIRKRYYRSVSNYYTEENVEQKIQDKTELYRIQSEKQRTADPGDPQNHGTVSGAGTAEACRGSRLYPLRADHCLRYPARPGLRSGSGAVLL